MGVSFEPKVHSLGQSVTMVSGSGEFDISRARADKGASHSTVKGIVPCREGGEA